MEWKVLIFCNFAILIKGLESFLDVHFEAEKRRDCLCWVNIVLCLNYFCIKIHSVYITCKVHIELYASETKYLESRAGENTFLAKRCFIMYKVSMVVVINWCSSLFIFLKKSLYIKTIYALSQSDFLYNLEKILFNRIMFNY